MTGLRDIRQELQDYGLVHHPLIFDGRLILNHTLTKPSELSVRFILILLFNPLKPGNILRRLTFFHVCDVKPWGCLWGVFFIPSLTYI